MSIKIALAGNPNCGKTTLFNALTGSNQFVGNWPGVTVEKKEGRLKGYDDVILTDLPGIYSLSPYTLEEVVARNYLVEERPDAILNIVDGTNLERNLYLTTQLIELGIPVVIAINMMDVVAKNGDVIDKNGLSKALGCSVFEISALKLTGITEAAEAAIEAAKEKKRIHTHSFSGPVEHALAHIEEATLHGLPQDRQRWYAIKIFERDEKVLEKLGVNPATKAHIEEDIVAAERELDDDAESIITNERYDYITNMLKGVYVKKNKGKLTVSDKIDRVVTNRVAALPIFAFVMFLVYYLSVTTVGTWATDWMNDGVFGDGWHLFGIGSSRYEEAMDDYAGENLFSHSVLDRLESAKNAGVVGADEIYSAAKSGSYAEFESAYASYGDTLSESEYDISREYELAFGEGADIPERSDFPVWIPGIPTLLDEALVGSDGTPVVPEWLYSLVMDGIVGGVGAVLGFVPQIFVLFIFLAFLEACGYMSRIAFVMDRIFRKIGLSGKSFIPMLIGTGCSVPGIMASRTIENERDRRMTIITTPFIPCGAKLPVIALISGALFGGAWWVAPTAYFMGITAVVVSGVILKKTKMFSGDPAPFVMELPAYHMPTLINVLRSMWERGWSFIKKAGTVILLSTVIIWLGSNFGYVDGGYVFGSDLALEDTILGGIGIAIGWIFAPLGFSGIETSVATVMGLVAKEEIVAVLGVLDFIDMSKLAAFSFLMFNLLCAPCFAAVGAIRKEMNSSKWTWFAIGYQCSLSYVVSFCIYQLGSFVAHGTNVVGAVAALVMIGVAVYLLLRPNKYLSSSKKKSK